MLIPIESLNCSGCPAYHLFDGEKIIKNEKLRESMLESIGEVKLFLLGESTPANKFVYDLNTSYSEGGLRLNLQNELVHGQSDIELIKYLSDKGILVVDCALCPLHIRLLTNTNRREAATICLKRHMIVYLNKFPSSPIITFFPSRRGFKKTEFPEINLRIVDQFNFNDLKGLKDSIKKFLTKNPFD